MQISQELRNILQEYMDSENIKSLKECFKGNLNKELKKIDDVTGIELKLKIIKALKQKYRLITNKYEGLQGVFDKEMDKQMVEQFKRELIQSGGSGRLKYSNYLNYLNLIKNTKNIENIDKIQRKLKFLNKLKEFSNKMPKDRFENVLIKNNVSLNELQDFNLTSNEYKNLTELLKRKKIYFIKTKTPNQFGGLSMDYDIDYDMDYNMNYDEDIHDIIVRRKKIKQIGGQDEPYERSVDENIQDELIEKRKRLILNKKISLESTGNIKIPINAQASIEQKEVKSE